MASRRLWGGRFEGEQDETLHDFSESFSFDQVLWREDLAVLRAHVGMLAQTGILKKELASKILPELDAIEKEIDSGEIALTGKHEDIDSFIEEELARRIGEDASLIRVARSR